MSSRAKKKRLARINKAITDEMYENFLNNTISTANQIIEDYEEGKLDKIIESFKTQE